MKKLSALISTIAIAILSGVALSKFLNPHLFRQKKQKRKKDTPILNQGGSVFTTRKRYLLPPTGSCGGTSVSLLLGKDI
jgi:hypothetical protein